MKYLAAYCLLVLGGNAKPSKFKQIIYIAADDVKKVLKEVDAEVNDADLKKVVDSLTGKKLEDVVKAGLVKVGGASFGGGASSGKPAEAKKDDKKEAAKPKEAPKPAPKVEEKEESFEGGLDMFG